MNLIINARDAMPEGGEITISGENRKIGSDNDLGLPAGPYVLLAVTDSGCGIAPEILEQVLEPFFTTKDVGKGTGLGLSMVYGFAKQSGGAIDIQSKLGEGTRVEIWLPRAPQGKGRTPAPRSSADGGDAVAERPLNILLVDDHGGVRMATAGILHDLGHQVTEACDGPELLGILERDLGAFDLVICDYAMPLVSGIDVIEGARKLRPGMPGIIVTGYADAKSIARRPHDVPVLTKPFTSKQINDAIASLFRHEAVPKAN